MNLKKLLMDLYSALTGEEIHNIVCTNGLDGPDNWRPYGDSYNNAGTFENQQSSPEASLVEKIINALDSLLEKLCRIIGIDPKDTDDPELPVTMSAAVEKFCDVQEGRWENVTEKERQEAAQEIQIIVSGDKKTPNVAIYDHGVGQNPEAFPDTFLSIGKGNKVGIPFVQGKFNFGSTGALAFCGEKYRYQLIISRRCRNLPDANGKIGFTLVRRHILTKKEEKNRKMSWYEYLVIDGEIPSINEQQLDLDLFEGKPFEEGTVVKLYNYQLTKPSIATLDLWRNLNSLMFAPAMPILIIEGREYSGHSSSKLLLGNRTRLELDSRSKIKLHKNYSFDLDGNDIPMDVYVFFRDKSNKDEFTCGKSVIYVLNGQTQGSENRSFISQDLGFVNLRDHILISVDFSGVSASVRQDLFMASRDRLRNGKKYKEIKKEIVSLLHFDQDLQQLDREYKQMSFHESVENNDIVTNVSSVLKKSMGVSRSLRMKYGSLNLPGKKFRGVSRGHKANRVGVKRNLRYFPSFLRIRNFERDDETFEKKISLGNKGIITFETDASDDFLSRSIDTGKLEICIAELDRKKLRIQVSGPHNGEIRIFAEPCNGAKVGDTIPIELKLKSVDSELCIRFRIAIGEEVPKRKTNKNRRTKRTVEQDLRLPKLICVVRENPQDGEITWDEAGMSDEDIVKLGMGPGGTVEEILINVDSKLAKRLIKPKNTNVVKMRESYLTNIYSHILILYDSLYNAYRNNDVGLDEEVAKEILETLSLQVESSFKSYAELLVISDNL